MSKDYYKILGVEKGASVDEIKKAFKKKAMEHHPDRPGGNEAKFKEVNEAYQVLSDASKRQKYDQFGSDFEQQGGFGGGSWEDILRASRGGFSAQGGSASGGEFNFGGMDFGDLFGNAFGSAQGGQGRRQEARGRDVQVDVELDFKEAVFGVEKELNLKKQEVCDACKGDGAEPGSKIETCATCKGQGQVVQMQRTILGNIQTISTCSICHGRGKRANKKCLHCNGSGIHPKSISVKVKIPAGIDGDQSIRLTGHGEAAPHQGTPGDLYVQVHVRPSKQFERDRFDVYTTNEISYSQAVLGATIAIETIDGSLSIKIPEATESGTLIRLKGKGIPEVNGRGRGDHFVRVKITVPKKVSREAKNILEQLDGVM